MLKGLGNTATDFYETALVLFVKSCLTVKVTNQVSGSFRRTKSADQVMCYAAD